MDYSIVQINGKEVFICEHHHYALFHWNKYKKEKPYLLTFDHHTDTRPAFQNFLYHNRNWNNFDFEQQLLIKEIKQNNIQTILKLKNDEHIDASVRANLIKKVLILSEDSNPSKPSWIYTINGNEDYNNEPIIVNSRSFDNSDLVIESNNLKSHFKKFELCIPQSMWINNYILDIDLDFFKTTKSVNPSDCSYLKFLIKKSKTITIAKEETFVNEWKNRNDKNFCVQYLLDKLITYIYNT